MTSLEEWLSDKEHELLTIRGRLDLLKPLRTMLPPGTKIRNRQVYFVVVDSYEMLVIDLASFLKALANKDVNQLNNHLSQLKRGKRPKDPSRARDTEEHINSAFAEQDYHARQEVFERLFPDCTGDHAQQEDVRGLANRLRKLSTRCIESRDNIHAHRYEEAKKKKGVTAIDLPEIETLFVEIQSILNDLRLIAVDGHFGYGDIPEETQVAMDLRDIILHGTIGGFCMKLGLGDGRVSDRYYWQLRDEYYATHDSPEED
jgi:hypothetical protein